MNELIRTNPITDSTLLRFDPDGLELHRSRNLEPAPVVVHRPAVEHLSDGSIRLRAYAPEAKEAVVVGGGGNLPGEYPMEQEGDGWWAAILPPRPAGLYPHRYRIDGTLVTNPLVPYVFGAGEPVNFIEAVDDSSLFYALTDVPHGDLRMELYPSPSTGGWRNCWVYAPPGYDASDESYPVLYLQHGAGENETGWIDQGKVNFILDNLLAQQACVPMLVVMNCGYCFEPGVIPELFPGDFNKVLVEECIPFIESKYRVIADREHRAMAGLSMGSAQAQDAVYSHLDTFAWCGVIIGSFFKARFGVDHTALFEDMDALARQLRLLFVSNGSEEAAVEGNIAAVKELRAQGLNATYRSYPGYHELGVCRKSLRDLLPLLFRD